MLTPDVAQGRGKGGRCTTTSRHAALRATRREVQSLRPLWGRFGLRPSIISRPGGFLNAMLMAQLTEAR
ncbi:MAG: hypothetical protein IKX31_01905 [Muribaculaceae bacterium]|nr:hypothetical protein [Muribaculaceae bacterium]